MEILNERLIKNILLKYRIVAIVGLSRNSSKDSYQVAKYLKSVGYNIIPVNPRADEILNEKCYRNLGEIPEKIEIVDIFRPSEKVLQIVKEAIKIKRRVGYPKVIWMQLGIVNNEAAKLAINSGLFVVMNRCMRIEHRRLISKRKLTNQST